MKFTYLFIDISSFIIPFISSFHPRLKFYKEWNHLAIGIFTMLLIFIPWDVCFTYYKIWGFNPQYLTGLTWLYLPIEEWLFFLCIPYACIFIYHAFTTLYPSWILSLKNTRLITLLLLVLSAVLCLGNINKWYSFVNYGLAVLILGIAYKYFRHILQRFYPCYLIILIPFFIVNGVLTGSFIKDEVVWYNPNQNLNLHIGTIPIEDVMYNLTMLLIILLVMSYCKKIKKK